MSGVAPGRLREAAAIFEELVDSESSEVRARLDALEALDSELAQAVRGLLAADAAAGAFLESGASAYSPRLAAEADQPATRTVGPYVLRERLGRGGMGDVWVAERRDGQFEQRVALKLLKPGMDSDGIRRRFLQERQLLARLEHPNIARLLDGGTAADGRPFFVMELVEGVPITEFCRERDVSLEQRLTLVATCADAVAAAHRRLIVHRDIKPSNVLVTRDGTVKLLDFGIARVLSDEGDSAGLTRTEERVLTPRYAAPEQILGEPVTTATDAYALGAVLYELLTGGPPHAREASSAAALASRVETETLEKPSRAVLAGAADPLQARRISRRLEGDVDAIALKALRREPERRYPGAADLAEDLRRFLSEQRVEARPDTVVYRLRKFVRRHRAGVAAAVVIALALVAGLAATTWQAAVARANARRAERVQEFLVGMFRGSDPTQARGRDVTARELLTAGTRRVESDLRGEPEVQAALYDAVAQIQCSLGALPEARSLADRSLEIRRRLFGPKDPRTVQSLVTLAQVRAALAEGKEAEQLLRSAVPVLVAAYGEDAAETIRARSLLVEVLANQGAGEQALPLARAVASSLGRRFGSESPEAATALHEIGMIQEGMSRFDDAEAAYRRAVATLDRTVGLGDPRDANAHASLAELLSYRGRRAEAEKEFGVTLAALRKSLGPDHPAVAGTLIDLGLLCLNERRYPEADAALEESLRIYRGLNSVDAANSLRILAVSFLAQERFAEARQRIDECLAIARQRYGPKNQITLTALGNLGDIQLHGGDAGSAEATLREAIAGLEAMFGKESDSLRAPLNNLGELARLRGQIDEAEALHRRVLAIQLQAVGADAPSVPGTRLQLTLDLLARPTPPRISEARDQIDRAIALQRRIDAEHPRLDEMLLASAEVARAQNDVERARRELAESLERLRRHHGSADVRSRKAEVRLADLSKG